MKPVTIELILEIAVWCCILVIFLLICCRHRAYFLLGHYLFAWLVLVLRHTDPADTEKGDGSTGYRLGYSALTIQTSLVLFTHWGCSRGELLRWKFFRTWTLAFFLLLLLINLLFICCVELTRIGVAIFFICIAALVFGTSFRVGHHALSNFLCLVTAILFFASQALETFHASVPSRTWDISPWSIHYIVWILLSVANIASLCHTPWTEYRYVNDDDVELHKPTTTTIGLNHQELQFLTEVTRQYQLIVRKSTIKSQCTELEDNLKRLTELRTKNPSLDSMEVIQLNLVKAYPFPVEKQSHKDHTKWTKQWANHIAQQPTLLQPFCATKTWNVPLLPIEMFMMLSANTPSKNNKNNMDQTANDALLLQVLTEWKGDRASQKGWATSLATINATQIRQYATYITGFRRIFFDVSCPFLLNTTWAECLECAQMLLLHHERLVSTWFVTQRTLLSTDPILDSTHQQFSRDDMHLFLQDCLHLFLTGEEQNRETKSAKSAKSMKSIVVKMREIHPKVMHSISYCRSTLHRWTEESRGFVQPTTWESKTLVIDTSVSTYRAWMTILQQPTLSASMDTLENEFKNVSYGTIATKLKTFLGHCTLLQAAFQRMVLTHVLSPAQHTALWPLLEWTQMRDVRPENVVCILRLCIVATQSIFHARDWIEANCLFVLMLQDVYPTLLQDAIKMLQARRIFFDEHYFCFEHTIEETLFSAQAFHRNKPPPTLSGLSFAHRKGRAIQLLQTAWESCRLGQRRLYEIAVEVTRRGGITSEDIFDLKQRLMFIVEDHLSSHPALPPPSTFLVVEAIQCMDRLPKTHAHATHHLYVLLIWTMALFSDLEGQSTVSHCLEYYYDNVALECVKELAREFKKNQPIRELNPVSGKMQPRAMMSKEQSRAQRARKQFNVPLYVTNPWKV